MHVLAKRALIPIAIAQFLTPLLPSIGVGVALGDRATAAGIPPELPPGLFFSIWGVVFIGYFFVAVWAQRSTDAGVSAISVPLAFAGLGNIIWMVSAQTLGIAWLDFLLLFPILIFSWEAVQRLELAGGGGAGIASQLMDMVTGLLAGWLSVAVSISVPDLVRTAFGYGASDHVWPMLWLALVPAGIMAWIFASRFGQTLWYFAALGWGLIGIAVNNWFRTDTHALALASLLVGGYVLYRRLRFGARGAGAPAAQN